jgi:hypothetical protein
MSSYFESLLILTKAVIKRIYTAIGEMRPTHIGFVHTELIGYVLIMEKEDTNTHK